MNNFILFAKTRDKVDRQKSPTRIYANVRIFDWKGNFLGVEFLKRCLAKTTFICFCQDWTDLHLFHGAITIPHVSDRTSAFFFFFCNYAHMYGDFEGLILALLFGYPVLPSKPLGIDGF